MPLIPREPRPAPASQDLARRAARLVDVMYADEQPPILTVQAALEVGATVPTMASGVVAHGDAAAAIAAAEHSILRGQLDIPSQGHFYLEPQASLRGTGAWSLGCEVGFLRAKNLWAAVPGSALLARRPPCRLASAAGCSAARWGCSLCTALQVGCRSIEP
jgi:hypothetical protein